MKRTFISLFFLVVLIYETSATTRPILTPRTSFSQQLVNYLSFPRALRKTTQNVSVIVCFRVGADNRVDSLKVFSQDQQLNADLARQLIGKKLKVPNAQQGHVHTLRLRFMQD